MKRQTIFKSMLCLLMALVCSPLAMQAKVEHLLPKVHSLNETGGTPFALQRAVTITDANNTAALKKVFTDYGCTVQDGAAATVTVEMVESIEGAYDYTLEGYDNEGYQLIVEANAITIKAVKPIGVIRAAQTLAQLAEGYEAGAAAIETVEITDWAAFKLRGYMHDVGRSFISVDELKKHIELLSRFKVNTFHWHFTENQAWRFEVEGYPQLTADTSMTRFAGKYYTQEQCREVAAYAKEHGITIIPEIDMPGHSAAFKRAMGYSMQTDEGVAVLKKVLTQLVNVFPDAPYIHIGADEETITYTDSEGNGFLSIIASHVRETLQRKLVVWNPIHGVSINNTMCDMTQMWSSAGKDITGTPDIDCRYNYTNHFDVFADVVGIYKSNIYYKAQGDEEIAGTISAYWNDRKTPTEEDIVKQNNLYANVLASAERAWYGGRTDGTEGYIEKLGTTLPNSGEVYEEFKNWEERFLFHKANSLKDEPIPYVKQTNVRWRITDAFPNGGNSAATFGPDQYATSTDDEGLIPETFTHEGKTYYTGMATGAGIYLRHTWGNNTIPTYYGSTNYSNSTAYAWTYVYSPKAQTVGAQIEFQNYGRSEHDKTPYADKWDRKGSDIWLNGTRINPPTWVNPDTDPTNEDDLQNENFTARTPIEVQLNEGWNKVFIKLPYVGADGVRLNKWMFTFVLTDLEGKNAVDGLIYSPNQCMDEATEAVAAKISEMKRDRGALIGTAVGLWPESAAETLDAKIAEVEATYAEEKTADERAAQVTALEEAWTTFTASLTDANMNLPVSGNYYRMYTPLRDSRYITGNGVGNAATGETTATTKASVWKFANRGDGSYDIINVVDGTYISPASSNNSALNCVADQPTAGWTLKRANTNGYVIVTSTLNNAQFNQTNSGQSYKLYNWGYGSTSSGAYNNTDTGCQYELIDVTDQIPPQPIVKLVDLTKETYPYAVDATLAAKVFAQENITIAVDVMMPASLTSDTRYALVCAADPTVDVTGTTQTNSPYIAYGLNGTYPVYLPSSKGGDKFTYRDFAATANTKYKIVYVIDKTNKQFSIYVNGELKSTATYPVSGYELQSFSNFATNANAKLYIGAGAVSSNASYDKFGGQVRSVQFFEGALNAAKVAQLEYPVLPEDIILDNAAEANANMNIFGLQRYLGLVQNAGTGIEGNGQFVCNYPAATSQESGNAYANLIDGSYTTFFHSGYGSTIGTGSHYLQADLGKKVNSFRFYFKKRSQNNNNRPTKITIEGSNDGDTWSEVKVISSGLPTSETVLDYYSEEISSETAYQHYRFTVNSTNNSTVYYTFSEFYILPSASKVVETFDAIRAYRAGVSVETATALNNVYAWNKGVNEGSPIVGVESYIYADTKQSDGSYVARFLYNNNGTLATSSSQESEKAFVWVASQPEGTNYYTFQNVGDETKYLGYGNSGSGLTINTTPVQLDIQSSYAVHTGSVGVMRIGTDNAGKWMVTKADGTSFNRNSVKINDGNWCSDYVFIPVDLYKEAKLYVKAEVVGLEANNPNTHLGSVRVNSTAKKFKLTTGVTQFTYNDLQPAILDLTRAYRGFEFQGFFLGEQNLGTTATLTEEQKALITEANPLVAKFIPTTTKEATLFYDDDEFSYRIPAIATTSTGRLIAVSDYRHSLDDIGRYNYGTANPGIDLVIRTSDDNGVTWSDTKTIAAGSGTRGTDDCAYGDAAIAVVGQKILVMGAAGDVMFGNGSATAHNRTVRLFSENNGETWTQPQDISETLFIGEDATIKNGYTAFFGSGKLAVDENYNNTGNARIYGAMLIKKEGYGNAVYAIYTDDFGLTWSILGGSQTPVTTNDEPKVEILPSGQILLSVRRGGGRQFNVFTYTDKATNTGTWSSNVNGCGNGGSNSTNGEIFLVDAKNEEGTAVKLLLQSQPKGGSGLYDRRDVTIWYKEVDNTNYTSELIAADWTEGLQVSTQLSAYSTMSLQKDGKIAFFFEEAPCYGDDYAKGYCMVYVPLTIEDITKNNYSTPEEEEEVTSQDALPGDGTLRFYRLAIPVTLSAYTEDLGSSYENVKAFWQECEEFVNKMFIPLGMCFEVVENESLVSLKDLTVGNSVPEIGNCTSDLNTIIGEGNYDVAMWVMHRDDSEENSGQSAVNGAYSTTFKGNGYAKTDKWVVAHELGHMFGAPHTTTGEGSLMDTGGEYFAYPSIKIIRNSAIGKNSYNNVKVANNAPQFDEEEMLQTYRIPQGACLSIEVHATDMENHKLMYTAIGCNSTNVGNVIEGGSMPAFASFAPQESNIISYQPTYTAEINNETDFYLKDGTNVPEMEAGTYPLSILVNDVPSTAWSYAALATEPFYSSYAIWETEVQIVEGTAFTAALSPASTSYEAGEEVTVSWGVNSSYFTADSKVRITLSTDYGKTFKYVLAESVSALDGQCTVTLPNVNIGQVDVDFTTATRKMNGGVIKVEEIGGAAYTLTALDPNADKGFTVSGGVNEEDVIITTLGAYEIGTFYANEPMTIPTGVTAYVATQAPSEGVLTMTRLNGIIPAKTGAVICGAEGQYLFTKADAAGTTVTGNMLHGYAGAEEYAEVALPEDGSVNYVLTVKDNAAGFYRKKDIFKVYNNKAYLQVPGEVATSATGLRIRFGNDEDATGIEMTTDNGQQTTVIYDLMGRRVENPTHGVYIVNGKKVVIR